MSNKLDPVHAVASMALALVEIQKDLGALHRKFTELTDTVVKMDSALISKFNVVDRQLQFCLNKLKEEVEDAADQERKESNEVDDQDLRSEEGQERLLRDDKRGEAEGGSREEVKEEVDA